MMQNSAAKAVNVVYNLYECAEGLFLVNAYIVSYDRYGKPAHIQQKAIEATIGAFGLELDAVRTRLFALIEQLQPKALEQRFNPPRKKAKPLEELYAQDDLKGLIAAHVHRRLDEVLSLVQKHRLPLCWDAERKVLVGEFLMNVMPGELQPLLSFARQDGAVRYRMKLREGEREWRISSKDVVPITNHPAWVFADYRLYRIAHINGNMVKPFKARDEVLIPAASVTMYFRKFIVKVVSKLDIEAEGFDVVQHRSLLGCRLEAVQDLFTGHWALSAQMQYQGTQFSWRDKKAQRSALDIKDEDISIIKVSRDFGAEAAYLEKLPALGIRESDTGILCLDAPNGSPHEMLEWLAAKRHKLEQLGFGVTAPEVEGKTLYLYPSIIQLSTTQEGNDWFDIHGHITIGEYSIPFAALAKCIRLGDPFYLLPNGEYFLIPEAWMTKYHDLMQFAKAAGEHLRIAKSQYTLLNSVDEMAAAAAVAEIKAPDYQPSPLLKATLRPYQLEGVKWLLQLYHNQLGACLADDMGLGKTLQTIAVLLHAKANKAGRQGPAGASAAAQLSLFQPPPDADFLQSLNALIILPASLIFNWDEEINRFAPSLTVYRHVGNKRHKDLRLLSRFDIILTTYQTALRDEALLSQLQFEYIILDESQQIKNRESKVFHAINNLDGLHKISLSGTPIENSLSDLWSQMQFINPELLGHFNFFRKTFIVPIERAQDEEKKEKLRQLVGPYMLRRTKEEVAKDLPPLSTRVYYSDMTPEQKKLYEREKSAARNYLLDNFAPSNAQYKMLVIQTLTKLRQLANHPKLAMPEYEKDSGKFQDVLEEWDVIRKAGHKTLIFSSFVQYLNLFREHAEAHKQPYAWLTGDLTQAKRIAEIKRFQEDASVQTFLISIKTGGAGLNLTAADYVFILDPWWNPMTEQQAIARAHRIGQDKSVFALKFITKDSIEEKILKLQDKKAQLAEDIIGNTGKLDFSRSDLDFLLG